MLGAGVAARKRRARPRPTHGGRDDTDARCERKVERRLDPVEPALHVGLPRCAEVRPAYLVEPAHARDRAGIQHQDVGMDAGEDALGGRLVGNVGSDHANAESLLHRGERGRVARHDGHFGAAVDQGLDEPEAQPPAAAGHYDGLVPEAHASAPSRTRPPNASAFLSANSRNVVGWTSNRHATRSRLAAAPRPACRGPPRTPPGCRETATLAGGRSGTPARSAPAFLSRVKRDRPLAPW